VRRSRGPNHRSKGEERDLAREGIRERWPLPKTGTVIQSRFRSNAPMNSAVTLHVDAAY